LNSGHASAAGMWISKENSFVKKELQLAWHIVKKWLYPYN
jgi:hypothetical protein